MSTRVLHLLSQRPSLTGSGVTLEALVRHAAASGRYEQRAVVGVPAEDPRPRVADLSPDHIRPVVFETRELPFPIPGMSDVMPYRSSRWSSLTEEQLATYRAAFRGHIAEVVRTFRPHLIHAHHLWLMGSLVKDVAPEVPVLGHSHATGLRQMQLCPELAAEVRRGCARDERLLVLHRGHARAVVEALGVAPERVCVVGAGYREALFHARDRAPHTARSLVYAGKYSHAKGLPWLLDAVERLAPSRPGLVLHVAGSGAGAEADALRRRMEAMAPRVRLHGHVSQEQLAALMRGADVFVLPSFYEGLPLVLVEALACGCRLVATELPGVVDELGPHLDQALERVPLPRLVGPDRPAAADLPAFVEALAEALDRALALPPLGDPARTMPEHLAPFTWRAVFQRVEALWQELT